MQVTRLWSYPIKSMGGVAVTRSTYDALGLAGDRRWAVLDETGNRISARECPALLGLTAATTPTGLILSDRSGNHIQVADPGTDAAVTTTRMSRIESLTLADSSAAAWISKRIGRPVRLAWQAPHQTREIGESHGGHRGDLMTLADAGPILVVTESSLREVMSWVADESADWESVGGAAQRFRPNVVLDGEAPFAEDGWDTLRVGDITWRRGELCDRCSMTLIDSASLQTTKEPLRSLAQRRKWDGATWFGVRFIPELAGGQSSTIAVGDMVHHGD